MPIDVAEIQCDMLSATGRKYLRGPRGVGFLYVRESLIPSMEPPIVDHFAANWTSPDSYELRSDARRFENWENNYAAKLGLGAAVDYALGIGMDAIWERVQMLADDLRRRLNETNGITVHDIGAEQGGIVTFSSAHEDSAQIKQRLAAEGINISVSKPDSTLLDARRRNLPPICRASVHYYNDAAEIDRLMTALRG
jgi:selenocysteine lyase/cysteine desulfurase